jgi:hypothetical protein
MGRDAGPRGRERTQAGVGALQLGRSAGPSRREKGEGGPKRKFFFFFFFKNVNSNSICLFH